MLSSRTGKAEGKCSSRSDPWGFNTCVRAATECFNFDRVRWAMGYLLVEHCWNACWQWVLDWLGVLMEECLPAPLELGEGWGAVLGWGLGKALC